MKTKYLLLSTIMVIVLTISMFGQTTRNMKTKTDIKKHEMSSMMGKPTVAATVEGLHMKVWLMTQKQHKKMIKGGKMGQMMMHGEKEGEMEPMGTKGMKDTGMEMGKDMKGMKQDGMEMGKDMKGMKQDGMEMDKTTKEAMIAGTHYIMLDVTDAASGKEIANGSAKVQIVYPSKKNSSVDLNPVMSHFGGGVSLDEKGEYLFTINLNVGAGYKTTQFKYKVK